VEVCEIEVAGRVQSLSRGKDGDGSYVRFQGAEGQVSVFVPDVVLDHGLELHVGDRVAVAVDIMTRGNFTLIRAYSVHMARVDEKPEKAGKAE
jgi:hypothetical protein